MVEDAPSTAGQQASHPATLTAGRARVLAAVVTYNPDLTLPDHLAALSAQCDVVVIDNGSSNLAWIEEAAASAGCRLLVNDANLGIAAALSQAARMAQEEGFDWLATFDQDSLCPPGAIATLLEFERAYADGGRIGVLGMAQRDRALGRHYHHWIDILDETPGWRVLRTTITSGCMVRVALFRQVGLFDDSLFIDMVDHDFCMRARKHGWLVVESKQVVLEHSIGAAKEYKLSGRRIVVTHHSPLRRYYMTRNQLEVYARYALFDPVWSAKGLLQFGIGIVWVLLYEHERLAKLGAMLQGVWHFARRRFGPRP
jgi:rhamnosyltransferase